MNTIRGDLRVYIAEVLERIDDIKDEKIRTTALLGILNTLNDLEQTITKEIDNGSKETI